MIYFIPGYVALSCYIAVTELKFGEAEKLILSCAISFIVVSLLRVKLCLNIYLELLISLIICLIGAVAVAKLYQSKWFRRVCANALGFSFCQSPWEDVMDYKNGTNIRVKFKGSNRIVDGMLYAVNDVSKDPWIAISQYTVYRGFDDDKPYTPGMGACYMVNTNDIEYAEVYPGKAEE